VIDLLLVRQGFTDRATEGDLLLSGAHECWTIEDRSRGLDVRMWPDDIARLKVYGETAVPTGRYRLELYDSPKHGPDTLQLVAVPGFTNAQVHAANRAEELLGCIAVGRDQTSLCDDWVGGSKAALDALRAKVVPRMREGEDCYLTVEERPLVDERTS
jgi:hypothetical protein